MAHDRKYWEQWNDELSELVARGDCAEVRAFLDRAFWEGRAPAASWEHLKVALKAENKPMMKLLAAWGAAATGEDLARLKAMAAGKFLHYMSLLRSAGAAVSVTALKESPDAEAASPAPETLIPQEWKRVLSAAQRTCGEAAIAGETLCDLFNDRAVRSVDIFINHPYCSEQQREHLKLIFRKAGLEVTEQLTKPFPDTGAPEAFPAPVWGKLPKREGDFRQHVTQAWTVVAGPQRMTYNIVFVDRGSDSVLMSRDKFMQRLIEDLDFGLDQIAFDGEKIITTSACDADVKERKVMLKNLSDTSREQLQRIVKKYPDWELCPESKKLLPPSGWGGAIGCWPM